MCSPRILGAEQREERSVFLWGKNCHGPSVLLGFRTLLVSSGPLPLY